MNKLYDEEYIQNIADVIRSKNGSSDTYKVSEMSGKIEKLINPIRVHINNNVYYGSFTACVDSTEISTKMLCEVGDLLIIAFDTVSEVTVSEGWTLISTSEHPYNNQRLSFAYKFAEKDLEPIAITQNTSGRLGVTFLVLKGATGFVDNGYVYSASNSVSSITVEKPNGLTLFSFVANDWVNNSSQEFLSWGYSNNSHVLQHHSLLNNHLGVALDQSEDSSVTFTPSTATSIIVGSLTILGMDKFYEDIDFNKVCDVTLNSSHLTQGMIGHFFPYVQTARLDRVSYVGFDIPFLDFISGYKISYETDLEDTLMGFQVVAKESVKRIYNGERTIGRRYDTGWITNGSTVLTSDAKSAFSGYDLTPAFILLTFKNNSESDTNIRPENIKKITIECII